MDRAVDDTMLAERFDRFAAATDAPTPTLRRLEGRVRQRRQRRRLVTGGVAALVLLVGGAAALAAESSDHAESKIVAGQPPTVTPVDPSTERGVLTVRSMPQRFGFRGCESFIELTPAGEPLVATCRYDNVTTSSIDGINLTRMVGVASAATTDAFARGDAAAAAAEAIGDPNAADARFIDLDGEKVLALAGATVGPQGLDLASGTFLVLRGDDVVQIGLQAVTTDEFSEVLLGLVDAPEMQALAVASNALPVGSVPLIQGVRQRWVQPDPLRPEESKPFPGTTVGADYAVPGTGNSITLEVTTGLDSKAWVKALTGTGDDFTTTTLIGGRAAVLISGTGLITTDIPGPRQGPQLFVAIDDQTLVRVIGGLDSEAVVRSIASAFD